MIKWRLLDVDCDDSIVAVACYFYICLLDEQYKVSRRPNRRHDGAKNVNFEILS